MNQPAKAQEPSMEEILASIRRIIADDDARAPARPPEPPKPAAPAAAQPRPAAPAAPKPAAPPPKPAAPAPETMSQDDIDAMLAGFDTPPAAPAAPPSADILDLTESMAAPAEAGPAAPPSFRTIDGSSDVVFKEASPSPLPEPPQPVPPPSPQPEPAGERPLLSPNAAAAVDSAFNALAQTVLVHNARTLEDLVREMLRPMLKAWLDDNLPGLVERIVRAEIERVSRGRSG